MRMRVMLGGVVTPNTVGCLGYNTEHHTQSSLLIVWRRDMFAHRPLGLKVCFIDVKLAPHTATNDGMQGRVWP